MKKLLAFALVAAVFGTRAPLTAAPARTTTATTTRAFPTNGGYQYGYQKVKNYMAQCPTPTQQQWAAKRQWAESNYNNSINVGLYEAADYWAGYSDGLGEIYYAYC